MTNTLTPTDARAAWLALSSGQQTFLKWLALALMFLDHANRTLWSFQPWVYTLGRLAFPLFAFLIAYNIAVRGADARRYGLPLLIFGMVSQAPVMLALDRELLPLNIFFTLFLGSSLFPVHRWFAPHFPGGWVWQSLGWIVSGYLMLLLGMSVEYGPLGALLVPVMIWCLKYPSVPSGVALVLALALINGFQASSLAALFVHPCHLRGAHP
jgi:TraX protein.